MTAQELVQEHGAALVGRKVHTEAIGSWKGGPSEVLQLEPDESAPEIVMQVRRLDDGDEIGVFGYEEIELLD
jgi:hypothetical protein